jgi:phenylalanyl-tRNA synthetase beta chain
MTGSRLAPAWDVKDPAILDFFDMKGRIELLLAGLRYREATFSPVDSVPYLHPGKSAEVLVRGTRVGTFGELHPLVREKYELGDAPVLVAEFDLEALRQAAPSYEVRPVADFPPVYEDIAVIVDESVPAAPPKA